MMLHRHAHIRLWVFQLSHDKEKEQEEDLNTQKCMLCILGTHQSGQQTYLK